VTEPTASRPPLKRLIVPGLSVIVMLAVLIGLGTWQVERLAWKNALLAAVDAAEQGPAVPLPPDPPAFAKVRAEGRFDPATAFYGSEVRTERGTAIGGAHLLGVLRRADAAPLLVDRGWVPVPGPPPPATGDGPTEVEGYVRPAEPAGLFTPAPDPVARRFYSLDPALIGPALGVPNVAPFVLVALGPPAPAGQPDPARALPRPLNNHLSYALTWYGLAVALLVIFALYVRTILAAKVPSA
jgi:surfeit locus 1 family protein